MKSILTTNCVKGAFIGYHTCSYSGDQLVLVVVCQFQLAVECCRVSQLAAVHLFQAQYPDAEGWCGEGGPGRTAELQVFEAEDTSPADHNKLVWHECSLVVVLTLCMSGGCYIHV